MKICILFLIFLLSIQSVFAKTHLVLKNQENYDINTRYQVFLILNKIETQLSSILARLPDINFYVDFDELGGSLQPLLNHNINSNETVVGYVSNFNANKVDTIVLNKHILKIITNEKIQNWTSGHHTKAITWVYAAIFHELAHLIDFNFPRPKIAQSELINCQITEVHYTNYFKNCNEALSTKGHLSEGQEFKSLTRWSGQSELFHIQQSPDHYEHENINEYFAVNFEYFILDSNYKCRRPTLYNYFKDIFQITPFSDFNCPPNNKIYFSNLSKPIRLDPNTVIEIDFLHADSGPEIESRWGHSSFLIKYCDYSDSEIRNLNADKICPANRMKTIGMGFRAQILNNLINPFAGVIGAYPFRIEFTSIVDLKRSYQIEELRNLRSFKLHLTKNEIIKFVQLTLEIFWQYSGKYYFFSNNCAVESLQLIKSSVSLKHPIQGLYSISPKGLLQDLMTSKIISESEETIISSYSEVLTAALTRLKSHQKISFLDSIRAYINENPLERRKLITNISDHDVYKSISLYALEKYALDILESELLSKIETYIDKNKIEISMYTKPGSQWLVLHEYINISYGIPFDSELIRDFDFANQVASDRESIKKIIETYSVHFPDHVQRIIQTKENMRLIKNQTLIKF